MERLTRLQVCIDFSNKYKQDLSYLFSDDAMEEITPTLMAKAIGKSDQTIRRFENDEDFASPAKVIFKYAAFVKTEFRLEPKLNHQYESLGDFYIRNCFAVNNAIKNKVPNT